MAKLNPKEMGREIIKPINANLVKVSVLLTQTVIQDLNRIGALEAQCGRETSFGERIALALKIYLDQKDPVRRAERIKARRATKGALNGENGTGSNGTIYDGSRYDRSPESPTEAQKSLNPFTELRPVGVESRRGKYHSQTVGRRVHGVQGAHSAQGAIDAQTRNPTRHPLTADQKNTIFARDKGRCTHVDANGIRCNQDRWIHIHHMRPVSQGGTNDPSNLTTLCSFHHDLAHQMSRPIDGQITWLRERLVAYG